MGWAALGRRVGGGSRLSPILSLSVASHASSYLVTVFCILTVAVTLANFVSAEDIFEEGKSDKEILDNLLLATRYDKRLLPPVQGTLRPPPSTRQLDDYNTPDLELASAPGVVAGARRESQQSSSPSSSRQQQQPQPDAHYETRHHELTDNEHDQDSRDHHRHRHHHDYNNHYEHHKTAPHNHSSLLTPRRKGTFDPPPLELICIRYGNSSILSTTTTTKSSKSNLVL
ncbi:hypothetical protein TKK_0002444 [Trichogramma kaykai]